MGFLRRRGHGDDRRVSMVFSALNQICLREVRLGASLTCWLSTLPPGTGDRSWTMAQECARGRCGDRFDPQDLAADRCPQGAQHCSTRSIVPVLGICREHELFHLSRLRWPSIFSAMAGSRRKPTVRRCHSWAKWPLADATFSRNLLTPKWPVVATAPDGPHARSISNCRQCARRLEDFSWSRPRGTMPDIVFE